MKAGKVLEVAWKGLSRNKLRSLLTMLGVIIGVAAVIIMIAISAGTEKTIEEQITGLGSNLVYVMGRMTRMGPGGEGGGRSGGLVYADTFAIQKEIKGVAAVVVEQISNQAVKAGSVSLDSVTVRGTTSDFPSVREMKIATGRYFNDTEVDRAQKVVILGSTLATELFADQPAVGQVITVGSTKLTVIGVFKDRGMVGNTDLDSQMYTPIKVIFKNFLPSQFARIVGDRVNQIYVKLEDNAIMDDVILQIQLLLAKRHGVTLDSLDFTIQTQDDIIATRESTTAAFRSLLAWVAAVSLIVGGIGIMNIMLVSVTERTREIGIRQSVGATPADIRWQFLTEALLLSLVGGLLGVFAGVGGAWIFNTTGNMRTVVSPESILLAFSAAAAIGIFFGYYPANGAAQLDPIQALRHE